MDYLISILTILCVPLFSFLGVCFAEKAQTKRKGMDINANSKQVAYERLEKRLETLENKVDGLADTVSDFRAAHQQTVTLIEVLSDRVEKHNNVIDRTYKCEEKISVLEEKSRVANHRIDDLETQCKGA